MIEKLKAVSLLCCDPYTADQLDKLIAEMESQPAHVPEAHKQEPLTDEQCDAIYTALDNWAHEVDSYDFGLPLIAGGGAIKGREIIRAALGIMSVPDGKGDA